MAKKKEEWLTEAASDETWNSTDNAWYQQAMQTAQALLDRPAFSYDPAADPLYRTAKDQYLRQGRRAMEDVLGRTASLTGGYASSYAQTQASQAYDDQLTRLSALLPDYYDRARAAYDRETAALRDELGTAIGLYDKDYQVWLDRQSARERQTEADRKAEQWERQFAEDHDRWAAEFAQAAERWAAQQAASEARPTPTRPTPGAMPTGWPCWPSSRGSASPTPCWKPPGSTRPTPRASDSITTICTIEKGASTWKKKRPRPKPLCPRSGWSRPRASRS